MPIEDESDRADLLESLGETVNLDGREIPAIFDNDYLESFEGAGAKGSNPVAFVQTIHQPARGQSLTRCDGSTYTVRQIEQDGTGISLLRLRSG